MITIEFSPADIEALEYERYHHPHPKVQKKMEAVYLKSQDVKPGQICRLCRICKTTLTTYLDQYQAGGLERLKELEYQGQPSELNQHSTTLEAYFKGTPPAAPPKPKLQLKTDRSQTQSDPGSSLW
ncbi:MAG: helix-turn-helix domain-containing protein [Anaerolineales bacterium]|nr:helix-turn-helix domain-containing protein [Anaerolineales bacterium]